MAGNVNKVVYGGQTLIDLTGDTITENALLEGYTAHDKSGAVITGTCTFDVDSGTADVAKGEILNGKIAYARGARLVGSMPNNGSVNGEIAEANGSFIIAQGYHDGTGKVTLPSTETAKLVPTNIRQGVTVLGVTGTMSGSEGVNAQTKNATPSASAQTILPDSGYNYLTQVTVAAIPYAESDNAAGGTTVTIG